MRTRLTERLDIELPVVQAPIGSATCPALAAAVSNAGGLGMLAGSWLSPDRLHESVTETRRLTARPFGVNFVLEWDQTDRLRAALDAGVRIVSFTWGDATPHVPVVHAVGGVVLHTVGSTAEARAAATSGADVLVAQGWEAGGHVRGEVATSVLVPAVRDAVPTLPIIAAGGIADGRGMAAALALGADGVWLGTRFLASEEARVHPTYQTRIVSAAESDTLYTQLFDLGWPNAPHRVLRNTTTERWRAAGQPAAPARPGEGDVVAHRADGEPVVRYSDTIPVLDMTGDVEALALYAGQSAGLIRDVRPAGAIARALVAEAESVLAALLPADRGGQNQQNV